jgi:hypothetical protein
MHRVRLLLPFLAAALLLAAPAASASSSSVVVVSQVYAGGGNSGAAFTNDFVELLNRGSTAIDLSSWSVQYASAASTSWQVTPLSGSIQPGHYYLVQLASAASVGSPLPTPDATGTSNLAVAGGKVALVPNQTALSCGGSPGSCASAGVADLVGYGSAADYEGSGPAGSLSSTTAAIRAAAGCTDTDANAADFATDAPTPRNSASAPTSCSSPPTPSGVTADAGVDIDIQPVLSLALEKPTISFGKAAAGDTPAPISEQVTVTSSNASGYSLTVHRTSFAPADLPLGISVSGGAMAAIPIPPAGDLVVGTSTKPSGTGGDQWQTAIGFTGPLPVVPAGHYTATLTYTLIGK